MKKLLLAVALVFVLVPSVSSASTDEQIRASLTQQLLSMFVVQVNALDKMQALVASSPNPSQYDNFSALVADQLSKTTAQLSTLLNPTGAPVQNSVGGIGTESLGSQPLGGVSTPSLVLTDNLINRQPITTASAATVWGGSCDQIAINSNIDAHFVNPETGAVYTGKKFLYRPVATNITQTIFVSVDGLSTSTVQVPIGPSIYEAVMAKDPTGGGFNKYSSTLWSSKAIGRGVDPTTGLCN